MTYWVELYNGMQLDFDSLEQAQEYCIMNGIHFEQITVEQYIKSCGNCKICPLAWICLECGLYTEKAE